jgi:hypothetical protein
MAMKINISNISISQCGNTIAKSNGVMAWRGWPANENQCQPISVICNIINGYCNSMSQRQQQRSKISVSCNNGSISHNMALYVSVMAYQRKYGVMAAWQLSKAG